MANLLFAQEMNYLVMNNRMKPKQVLEALILRAFFFLLFIPTAAAQEPHKRMLDDPLRFTGPDSLQAKHHELKELRIGFFAPKGEHGVGESLWKGANLAVEEENQQGGYHDLPFRLVPAWAEDPWGAGSKEVIRLVYEEQVWALIGSVDGDSTHVAEQIATKARVPLIAPISSDSTLTYIRIPWIFRLPPSGVDQSELLLNDLPLGKMGLLTSTHHDGRIAKDEIIKTLGRINRSLLFHYQVGDEKGLPLIVEKMREHDFDSLILYVPPEWIYSLFHQWQGSMPKNLITYWLPGIDWGRLRSLYSGKIVTIVPFDQERQRYNEFQKKYSKKYEQDADFCAAYGYDAVRLIAHGIKQSGLSRKDLRESLAEMSFKGVSGTIQWDHGGGNPGKPIRVLKKWN